VGHEIDVTIADQVADFRALTPSEAAERVTPNRVELLDLVRGHEKRLRFLLTRQIGLMKERLHQLALRRVLRVPLERIRDQERRLDEWGERLECSVHERLARVRERATFLASRLESLSPLNVLARGYSVTRKEVDQAVVRNPEQVQPGERLVTRVQHGIILSQVEAFQPQAVSSTFGKGQLPERWSAYE
jgi:exodeoxyribonuclease VII large subunit